MTNERLFARIETLFDIGMLSQSKALIIGCGSGGGAVALQLVMSGIKNFDLVDNDILSIENVIRHVCGRRYLGWKKTDALEDVLLDRNPAAKIKKYDADIMNMEEASELIKGSDVVALCTDNDASRYYVNELCVKNKVPFVTARVFTRGIGGEVFSFKPEKSGCLACLESKLERTQYRQGIHEEDSIPEEEREKIYGMGVPEIKDSPGLNIDISFISSFHTRFLLDAIAASLNARPKFLFPIDENYIVWGNRPIHPFSKNFQLQRINIHKQDGCQVCGI